MSASANMFPKEDWEQQARRMLCGPSAIAITQGLKYKRYSEILKEFRSEPEEEIPLLVVSVPEILILMSCRFVCADLVLDGTSWANFTQSCSNANGFVR